MKKKVSKKKATAKKTRAKAAEVSRVPAVREAYTKTQLIANLVDKTGVAKKDVVAVLDELGNSIESHVKKRAVGHFTLPGLLKIKTVKKKATRARKGINPFTGEETVFKAKPARTVVKIQPLKKLKDMVE